MKVLNPLTGEGFDNSDDGLEHSGVKGMKWYQHKFGRWQSHSQYAGGAEDPNAKREKRKTEKEEKKAARKVAAEQKREERKAESEKQAAEREKKKKEKYLSDPDLLYKNRKKFTVEEINEAMKTFEWEKKLRSYTVSSIQDASSKIQSVVNIAGNSVKAYNVFAGYYNAFKPKGSDPMPLVNTNAGGGGDNKKKKKPKDSDDSDD